MAGLLLRDGAQHRLCPPLHPGGQMGIQSAVGAFAVDQRKQFSGVSVSLCACAAGAGFSIAAAGAVCALITRLQTRCVCFP